MEREKIGNRYTRVGNRGVCACSNFELWKLTVHDHPLLLEVLVDEGGDPAHVGAGEGGRRVAEADRPGKKTFFKKMN